MATEHCGTGNMAPQWKAMPEEMVQPMIKAEVPHVPTVTLRMGAKDPNMDPHVIQAGSIRATSEVILQQWETQWQEFLKTLDTPITGLDAPKLTADPTLEPWEDAKAFLTSFEQVAKACQWPKEDWVARLWPALSGGPKQAFLSLEAEAKKDYGKVKAAILRAEAASREKSRQQFWCFSYHEAEGPRGVYGRLYALCNQWLKAERRSKEQIVEQLILEQFLSILPQEMQRWVWEGSPETCAQAVDLAELFLLGQQQVERQEPQMQIPKKTGANIPVAEETQLVTEQKCVKGEINQDIHNDDAAGMMLASQTRTTTEDEDSPSEEASLQMELCRASLQSTENRISKDSKEKRTSGNQNRVMKEKRKSPTKKAAQRISTIQTRVQKGKGQTTRPWSGKTFKLKTPLVQPEGVHTGEKPYKCSYCGKSFCRRWYVFQHYRIHTGEKPFKCSYCATSFREPSHLRKHERLHTGEKPYKCSDCDKSFRQSSNLQRHLKMHIGVPIYKCPDCGKSFSEQSMFSQHREIHITGKTYTCSRCGEKFDQLSQLYKHQQTHGAERAFKCFECGKTFDHRSSFLKHKMIHTGEKPYKCFTCGRGFSQSSNLHKHHKIHTGEKLYKCSVCGKSFTQRSHLSLHQKTHKGFKTYKCLDCGDSFTNRSHLMKHKLTHQPVESYETLTQAGEKAATSAL